MDDKVIFNILSSFNWSLDQKRVLLQLIKEIVRDLVPDNVDELEEIIVYLNDYDEQAYPDFDKYISRFNITNRRLEQWLEDNKNDLKDYLTGKDGAYPAGGFPQDDIDELIEFLKQYAATDSASNGFMDYETKLDEFHSDNEAFDKYVKGHKDQIKRYLDNGKLDRLKGDINSKFSSMNDKFASIFDVISELEKYKGDMRDVVHEIHLSIMEETRRAKEAEEALKNGVDEETKRAKAAESDLNDKINSEHFRAVAKELEIDLKILQEKNRAIGKEQELDSKIDSEIARATGKETEIETSLNAEIERAKSEENKLATNLQKETDRAKSEEAKLSTALSAETERATNAEQVLTTNLQNEVTRATGEETKLNDALQKEIKRATDAETVLTTSLNTETSRAESVEQELQSKIETEKSRAESKETELHNEVETEKNRALGIEQGLKERLDVVQGENTVEGSIKKALKDGKDYTDQKVSSLVDNSPQALDTLNELAQALGDDPNFSTTILGKIGEVSNSVETERDRALGEESKLQKRIEAEEIRAKQQETVNHDAIVQETSRATERETTIDGKIDTEKNRATVQETELQNNITKEQTRATTRENEIENKITTETTRATNQETQLQSNIDAAKTEAATKATQAETNAKTYADTTFVKKAGDTMSGNLTTNELTATKYIKKNSSDAKVLLGAGGDIEFKDLLAKVFNGQYVLPTWSIRTDGGKDLWGVNNVAVDTEKGGGFGFVAGLPKAGQVSFVIDGSVYVNEGKHKVLDDSMVFSATPGANGSAAVSYNKETNTFLFTLPKGDQGNTGDAYSPSYDGSTGQMTWTKIANSTNAITPTAVNAVTWENGDDPTFACHKIKCVNSIEEAQGKNDNVLYLVFDNNNV